MLPALLALGMVGQVAGMFGSMSATKQAAALSQDEAAQEQAIEQQRHQQMVLNSQRQQLENIRNVQLARSMALTNATSQGAQQGTGLQGGLAQASDQGNYNALGISQNLEIGNNIFADNAKISQDKINMAGVQSKQAMWQGISSFGGSLASAGMSFSGNPFMGGGGTGGGSAFGQYGSLSGYNGNKMAGLY